MAGSLALKGSEDPNNPVTNNRMGKGGKGRKGKRGSKRKSGRK